MHRSKSWIVLAVAVMVTTISGSARAADSCQPVFDALLKMYNTASHGYSTETSTAKNGGQPTTNETINVGGKTYVRWKGQWKVGMDTKEMLEQEKENQKNSKATCQIVREDSLNGEAATLYSLHNKTDDEIEDGQVWISNAKGLPLREELDRDVGGGAPGKTHTSIRYEYGNVQPPL
jgi:hypothetical protein